MKPTVPARHLIANVGHNSVGTESKKPIFVLNFTTKAAEARLIMDLKNANSKRVTPRYFIISFDKLMTAV